ncbi:hypothetical protein ACEPAF_6109 [Sanghuangporus sanghuang]
MAEHMPNLEASSLCLDALILHEAEPMQNNAASSQDASLEHLPRVDFMSLPTEIFEEIIKILCADSREEVGRRKTDRLIGRLSRVSKEFREYVLNTEAFWTRVDDMYCVRDSFEERLARSKNESLSVHIDLGRRGLLQRVMHKALSRMLPLKHRWQEFSTRFFSNAGKIADDYPQMEFPVLKSLHLEFTPEDRPDKFFQQWKFPSITVLELVDAIPPPGLFDNLITFRLETIYAYSKHEGQLYEHLIDFLKSTPRLEHLSLKLSYCTLPFRDALSGVHLPNVTKLVLSNYDASISGDDWERRHGTGHLCQILSLLEIPKLKDFHLYLYLADEDRIISWFEHVSSATEALRCTTWLSVVSEFKLDKASLERLLVPFREVKMLELDIPGIRETLESIDSMIRFDELQSLVFAGRANENDWDGKTEARQLVAEEIHSDVDCLDAPLLDSAGVRKWKDRDPWV